MCQAFGQRSIRAIIKLNCLYNIVYYILLFIYNTCIFLLKYTLVLPPPKLEIILFLKIRFGATLPKEGWTSALQDGRQIVIYF